MQEAANLKAKKVIKEIFALSIGPKGYLCLYVGRRRCCGRLWRLGLIRPSTSIPNWGTIPSCSPWLWLRLSSTSSRGRKSTSSYWESNVPAYLGSCWRRLQSNRPASCGDAWLASGHICLKSGGQGGGHRCDSGNRYRPPNNKFQGPCSNNMWFATKHSQNSIDSSYDEGQKGKYRGGGAWFFEHWPVEGADNIDNVASEEEGRGDGEGCGRIAVEVAEGGKSHLIIFES